MICEALKRYRGFIRRKRGQREGTHRPPDQGSCEASAYPHHGNISLTGVDLPKSKQEWLTSSRPGPLLEY